MNLFFLVTLALSALTAFLALRWLGASRAASLVASVLFAVLPFRFIHNEGHLFLTAYVSVPLVGVLLIRLLAGEPIMGARIGAACARGSRLARQRHARSPW